ncbi:MAG: ATP-binding protein [Desulfotomaculum sp.]|nr:ATP-binding protein [Desulfotomaculum sp.]
MSEKDPVDCPRCQDRGLLLKQKNGTWVAVPCKCKKIKALQRMIKSSGLTEEQRAVKLEDYKPTPATSTMYTMVKRYLQDFKNIQESWEVNKGLGLMGTVGIGKTHLLLAVANTLLNQQVSVIFVNTPELIGELYDAQFYHDEGGLNARINKLGQAPVVIFDDVGKERITDWVQVQYYRVINQRYTRKLPTLFCSNLHFDGIAEKIGDASASRLYSLTRSRQVYVEARDYRI